MAIILKNNINYPLPIGKYYFLLVSYLDNYKSIFQLNSKLSISRFHLFTTFALFFRLFLITPSIFLKILKKDKREYLL